MRLLLVRIVLATSMLSVATLGQAQELLLVKNSGNSDLEFSFKDSTQEQWQVFTIPPSKTSPSIKIAAATSYDMIFRTKLEDDSLIYEFNTIKYVPSAELLASDFPSIDWLPISWFMIRGKAFESSFGRGLPKCPVVISNSNVYISYPTQTHSQILGKLDGIIDDHQLERILRSMPM